MSRSTPLLQLEDLRVDIGAHHVLRSVSLALPAGALYVLMGANGSGKSTLGLALAGHPAYQVAGGQAWLDGEDLLAMTPPQRARAGLFLSFQSPPDIPGVKNGLFVRSAINARREAQGETPLDAVDFLDQAREQAAHLGLPEGLLARPVNDGFSGGERKRNELLQLALLRPRVALLDEIDSGLDVDGQRALLRLVNARRAEGMACIVVSHYLQLIEQLEPDRVLRLDQGCLADAGGLELARELARSGYAATARAEPAAAAAAATEVA